MNTGESSLRVELIDPIPEMEIAYRRFLQEFIAVGEEGMLLHMLDEKETPGDCVERLREHSKGLNLPEGWAPCTTYWLLSEEEVLLGEVRIRHRLTRGLESYSGHVGYLVRPGERRKGYGTRMLAMALEKSRALGLEKIMITCDPANVASIRVIEKNGGRLAEDPAVKKDRRIYRYWIGL